MQVILKINLRSNFIIKIKEIWVREQKQALKGKVTLHLIMAAFQLIESLWSYS